MGGDVVALQNRTSPHGYERSDGAQRDLRVQVQVLLIRQGRASARETSWWGRGPPECWRKAWPCRWGAAQSVKHGRWSIAAPDPNRNSMIVRSDARRLLHGQRTQTARTPRDPRRAPGDLGRECQGRPPSCP